MRGAVVLGAAAWVMWATVLAGAPGAAAAPPSTPPPPTTVVADAPPTTVAADTGAGPATPVPTIPRAGSAIGGLDKRPPTPWSIRRIATTVGLTVAGLAVLGHLYGRLRSIGPRRPKSTALARTD